MNNDSMTESMIHDSIIVLIYWILSTLIQGSKITYYGYVNDLLPSFLMLPSLLYQTT